MPVSRKTRKVTGSKKKVARTLAKPKVRVTAPVQLTPAESQKLDRIAQAHAARMAAEFKDVRGVVQNFERVEPSLGGKDPGRLPGGRDPAAKGGGGSRGSEGAQDERKLLMPSTDLASYMTGAASGDATVTKDPSTGIVEKTWTERHDGTTSVVTSTYNTREGSTTSTRTTRQGDEVWYTRVTKNRDGSSDGTSRHTARSGRTYEHEWTRDPSGNLQADYFLITDRRGEVVREWDRAADRRRGLTRLPTDDAGTELGRRLAARFSHGATKPAPVVTQVNPGERDDSGPRPPKLNLGKRIVVNPGVEAGNQAREAGAARLKHWQRQLRDKVGGQVNPPGPDRRKS